MKSVSPYVVVFVVYGSLILGLTDSYQDFRNHLARESSLTYNYDRIDEVKKQCSFVLSSATEIRPGVDTVYSVEEELNVVNGDWWQEIGENPIMPFDDREMRKNVSRDPLKIVSFKVTNVDRGHRWKKYVSVSGTLVMDMTLDGLAAEGNEGNAQFQIWPGHTQLLVMFQGIYVESKKHGGERVLCMLGEAMLPSRESDNPSSDNNRWEWLKGPDQNYYQPPLLQDDQILLVLHSPMRFTLANRVIKGEMTSLNPKSNLKYFDKVQILSYGKSAKYEFDSGQVMSRACDPYPFQDSFINNGVDVYKGTKFCTVLHQLTIEGAFTVVPDWKCNNTDSFCSKFGPFGLDKEIEATDGSFKGVNILMQNVICQKMRQNGNSSSVKVAAVFRAAPPSENKFMATSRNGVSNMTVFAEGFWNSTSGQLCMVGCVGFQDNDLSSCSARICLYIPISFSIKQRSIIFGSFLSINGSNPAYPPLSFEKVLQPMELWNDFTSSHPHYTYTKIKAAGTILEKNEAFTFGTVVSKSLLRFPKLEETEGILSSLSLLSEDLTLHVSAVPDPFQKSRYLRTDVQMEILSLGQLFGRYWSSSNFSVEEEQARTTKAEYTERQLLMNVSAQLSLSGKSYSNFSSLFLEGLYDPHVGKMYLVGCRDVRASWKILFDSMDLENGLDCLIEVVVSYPPTTTRWLVNPTAKVSISSQRNEDDPLHFNTIKLQSSPIMYRKQREDILSRRGIEGILRILTLSFAITSILSQLFYFRHNLDSVPFVSLVMLGVQALGYSIPLITGAEALFKKTDSESYEMSQFNTLEKSQWIQVIDYTVKLLVLVSFLLTLRLCQKVYKSRVRLLSRMPLEPHRVPCDKRVLLITLTVHIIGFILVLVIHYAKTGAAPFREVRFADPRNGWETELEEYLGLVQDFFLFPQVIGNFIWRVDCKPLRMLYYIGITVVRLLPHVYDYVRSPFANPYFAEDYEFVNPSLDFYSKFGDIAIPVTAVILAAAVYVQQTWDYEKLREVVSVWGLKLLPSRSRVYERLPTKVVEAELSSGVNGNTTDRRNLDDDQEE